jgi:hypothetical protein
MVGCCQLVQFHWHLRWVCTFLSTRSARADLDFQVKSMDKGLKTKSEKCQQVIENETHTK